MKKDRLFVVFHASAAVDPQKQEELKKATFYHYPQAAYCSQVADLYKQKAGGLFINGDNLADAVKTIREQAKGQDITLVTLCPEMMKAASGRDMTLITVGAPPEGASFERGFYHADANYAGDALKAIARPFNR
ncbi:MAG: hypothetical protein DI586_10900 [Micavibrio aeruginosavorus]|uniref:Uncharacterized protein n=1 Tax=Micavibrio aeruginosavorus TaxID=349221 RepID=A0A2W5FBV4_9BACT|nr:MAG: hypothetical protein DI586_10900 [Micavibrio aeruginosavorus]